MRSLPLLSLLCLLFLLAPLRPPACRAADADTTAGASRTELRIPDALWSAACDSVGFGHGALGYAAEEMALYGRDRYRLRTVSNCFRDARAMLRYSGERSDGLLQSARQPSQAVVQAFGLTDVSAGRMLPLPDSVSWGAPWLPDSLSPGAALDGIVKHGGGRRSVPPGMTARWRSLPEPVQRLAVRVFVGSVEAAGWIERAYDRPFLRDRFGSQAREFPPVDSLYGFASAPWREERLGQLASDDRAAFEALDHIDRDYLAFGSVIFFAHLERALAEYRSAGSPSADPQGSSGPGRTPLPPEGLVFSTVLGPVRITGPGAEVTTEAAFLTIDLGGDDIYHGRQAVPARLDQPISVLIELGGDDRYEEREREAAMACGLFGLGVIVDLSGNDGYHIRESGLGTGWYGTGLLLDEEGDDTYEVDGRWGQGAAHAGVGLLIDLAGSDVYTCGSESQGMGSTLGAGLLIDLMGNDQYVARDDGAISDLYLGQSVAMAQGVGYGRRADLGDGHSLAGGFGLLLDGAGDDLYHAQVWSQGAGYWWGVGILEDRDGNDRYENGKYSLGAGAHFAIGCQVDLRGNDTYNAGNETAVNQYQGHARDGSIGISVDGEGDDLYRLKSHCGGSGDLASIGWFWDRSGNDVYEVRAALTDEAPGWSDTPPLGSATLYAPMNTFRDDLKAAGLFLDTGGTDTYRWENGPGRDNAHWSTRRGSVSYGFGLDSAVLRVP